MKNFFKRFILLWIFLSINFSAYCMVSKKQWKSRKKGILVGLKINNNLVDKAIKEVDLDFSSDIDGFDKESCDAYVNNLNGTSLGLNGSICILRFIVMDEAKSGELFKAFYSYSKIRDSIDWYIEVLQKAIDKLDLQVRKLNEKILKFDFEIKTGTIEERKKTLEKVKKEILVYKKIIEDNKFRTIYIQGRWTNNLNKTKEEMAYLADKIKKLSTKARLVEANKLINYLVEKEKNRLKRLDTPQNLIDDLIEKFKEEQKEYATLLDYKNK